MSIDLPVFHSDSEILNRAVRIASGDIAGNCLPFRAGLLDSEKLCVMAGLDYDTPWTRDAAINVTNALCIFDREISKNTLLAVCDEIDDSPYIAGQYWDAIIWAIGAWQYLCVNNDPEFARFAYEVIGNTLKKMETDEFDPRIGLFRGGAVYGDGIAAYPDKYTKTFQNQTGILDWPAANPESRAKKGFGVPMFTLSTNCVYYAAYRVAAALAGQHHANPVPYMEKAEALKNAVNRNFWNESTGRYDYLFDDTLRCDHAEALGLAFAVLFGIASPAQCQSIMRSTPVTAQGIACVWPSFERYRIGDHYGRHSGTIWPHAQGFWALACLNTGNYAGFDHEFWSLAKKANRDMQFAEIYHPITGLIYGGMQETTTQGIQEWKSCNKQTWSATAYWSMILYGLFGLHFAENTVTVRPHLPVGVDHMEIHNLQIGQGIYSILVDRASEGSDHIILTKADCGKHTVHLFHTVKSE